MIGLISITDKLHDISTRIFELINSNKLKEVYIPSSAYLEYELLLKSRNVDEIDIIKDIIHFQNIKNVKEFPLDSSIIVIASKLREKYNLTYFDSLHCASALTIDNTIIGTDEDFKKIPNLKTIDPNSYLKTF